MRDSTVCIHAAFLIKSMSQREECIRDIAVNLLTQLRDKFPQVKVNVNIFLCFTVLCTAETINYNALMYCLRFCGIRLV